MQKCHVVTGTQTLSFHYIRINSQTVCRLGQFVVLYLPLKCNCNVPHCKLDLALTFKMITITIYYIYYIILYQLLNTLFEAITQ